MLLTFFAGVDGLRLLRLSVPAQVPAGQDIQLTCQFDLEGETLYAVKWYQGNSNG